MKNSVNKLRKFLPIKILIIIQELIKVANLPTYFPQKTRKPFITRFIDLIKWFIKYHEINYYYNAYGLDIVGSDPTGYVDYEISFQRNRDRLNLYGKPNSMAGLLEDKYLFYKTLNALGLPTPEVFAFFAGGKLFDSDMNAISFDAIADEKDYFFKDAYGLCGNLVKHINNHSEFLEVIKDLPQKGGYVLQRSVVQCAESARLYPHSINTLRVITVMRRGEEPYVLAKFHRAGTSMSGKVDNCAVGGLAVAVKDDGYFKEDGFFKYTYGTSTKVHPDTGVVFKDYKVPMYDEAIELTLKAHKHFYNIHSIGWDIAFTDNGPVIIEGNENWDLGFVQFCDHPMRTEWEYAIKYQVK